MCVETRASLERAGMAMKFWSLEHPSNAIFVVDAQTGAQKSYDQLRCDTDRVAAAIPKLGRKSLGLLLGQNRYQCIVAYLAALKSNHALMLVDAALNRKLLLELVAAYRPDWISAGSPDAGVPGYRHIGIDGVNLWEKERPEDIEIHPSLALLLTTSGSTGSPKLVRLTLENLQANADSIASYLDLTAEERPITSLPMAYSYGLSVINSHLLAGACLVLTEHGVVRREFWDIVDKYECTSFSGVPYTYQMLLQMNLLKSRGSSLKTLTQAGGRLAEDHVRQMHALALERGCKFFVMYGQTEATARISYMPFEALSSKIGSIGIAVPNGSMRLDGETGELIYTGPNVMLGYAECVEDLAKGDELHGVLKTGDLARKDNDGFFYITGRNKRFLKMFGKRFNLDEVEKIVQRRFEIPVACFGRDDLLMVSLETNSPEVGAIQAMLRETFGLPRDAVMVTALQKLPRTASGKTDYQALANGERPGNAVNQSMVIGVPQR
jgi:acyl-CoA synthetase (AMP-forming)/AMP-acid ligase II